PRGRDARIRRRADHEGRVLRSIGRSPAGDGGKIERAPPPREPHLASAPRQTPISRPLDLSGLSTVTADASLVASCYTRMKKRSSVGTVVEEADESLGWLESIEQLQLAAGPEMGRLAAERHELVAIYGNSYRTAKENG